MIGLNKKGFQMEKPDIVETIEAVAQFAPEEIMVTDEMPMADFVVVQEPAAKKKDYTESQDLGDFMEWITGKMNSLPPHSGKTTAGCERVIAHLKMLDKEISKAIGRDVDCQLDDQAVEKFRKEIRKMVKQLDKRHKEINEAYDADDDKFAADESAQLIKEADAWKCPECGKEVNPGDAEHKARHNAMEHGHEANDKTAAKEEAPVYCKLCGTKLMGRKAAKAHADIKHSGENVTFSDMAPNKTGSDCACHIEKKADDNCPTCKIQLWKAAEGLYECISCDAVFERAITKEAGTPAIQLQMSPFERAVTGAIINGFVSHGKNPEEIYAHFKQKYKFTDRDELSIHQILADMGYPILKDRGHVGDSSEQLNKGKGIEFSTQYNA